MQTDNPNEPFTPDVAQAPQTTLGEQTQARCWVKWLVLWLVALPLGLVISFVTQFVFGGSIGLSDTATLVKHLCSILSILLALYMFVGWIPFLISYTRHKQ